jgi:GNAT superfamily N-acetyltransferase
MPPAAIRPARPADLDRLAELYALLQDHLEASNAALWRMAPAARGQLPGQLAARLAAAGSCCLVAEAGAEGLVGMAFGRVVSNLRYTPPRAGVIDQVFVLPDHRRCGLASRLVAGLCDFFAGQQVADLSLRYVHGNAEAAGFWAALGFAPRIVTAGAGLPAVAARLAADHPSSNS